MTGKIRTLNISGKEDKISFDWLLGVWENLETKNTFEEWRRGEEGALLIGLGFKAIKEDRVVSEYINIKDVDKTIVYEARLPHSTDMIPFTMIQVHEGGFFCENPDYDFPKRISYELEGYDMLTVVLYGTRKKIEFKFKKVK